MAGLTADQIIERIATANNVAPAVMRQQIEQTLQNITQPHSFMLADLFPGGKPTLDEIIAALEYDLYDAMMPKFFGWEWDGIGYRNIRLLGKRQ